MLPRFIVYSFQILVQYLNFEDFFYFSEKLLKASFVGIDNHGLISY